jgi:hypothetical protein
MEGVNCPEGVLDGRGKWHSEWCPEKRVTETNPNSTTRWL